ncbi:BA75_04883T0 [Komagataella pastoris]|uniref:BA75_04883T0 n=1 Tax=Komagataella pastoris TaxID=4922 RepID=A0A1B2JJ92_PICPA|nr:BA75_04883T0 [Komagataella pastoris]
MVNRISFEDDLAHEFSQFAPSLVSKYRHNLKDVKSVDKGVSLEEMPRSMIYKMFVNKGSRDKSVSHVRGNRVTSCMPELQFYEDLEPPVLPFKSKHNEEGYNLKEQIVTRESPRVLGGISDHAPRGKATASIEDSGQGMKQRSVSMFEPLGSKKKDQMGLVKKLRRNSKSLGGNSSSQSSRKSSLPSEIFKLPLKPKATSTKQPPIPESLKRIPAPCMLERQEKNMSLSHSRSTSTVRSSLRSNSIKNTLPKKSTKPLPLPPVVKEDCSPMTSTDSLDMLFDLYCSTTNSSTQSSIKQSPTRQSPTLETRTFHAKIDSGCSAPSTEPGLSYCCSSALDSQFSFEEEDKLPIAIATIPGKSLPHLPVKTFSQSEVRDYENSFKPKVLGIGIPPPLPPHFRRSTEIEARTDLERKPSQVKQEGSDTKIFTRKPRTLKRELNEIAELPEHSGSVNSIIPFILADYDEKSSLRVVNRTTPTPSRNITPRAVE